MEEEHGRGGERNPNSSDDLLREFLTQRKLNLLGNKINDLKATISKLKKEAQEELQRRTELKAKFEEYAGECLERLQNEQGFASQLLEDRSASLRWAAIYALRNHWRSTITDETVIKLLSISEHDDDPEVRWEAIWMVGIKYSGTKNRKVCEFLQKIMLGESVPHDIKERAKKSIWMINHGRV